MRRRARIAALVAALAATATRADVPDEDLGELRPSLVDLVPVTSVFEHLLHGPYGAIGGLFFDPVARELLVADSGQGLVAILDAEGVPRFAFGGKGVLREPVEVAADRRGNVYAVDLDRTRVKVFNYRGEYQRELPVPGLDPATPPSFTALAVDHEGNLYVGDSASSRVIVLDAEGRLLRTFGRRGSDNGQFLSIAGIAVDRRSIYVTDHQGIAVQVFDRRGNFVRGWGAHDVGAHNFSLPEGIAVDGKGRVFVVDALRHDVKVFEQDGRFVDRWGGFGVGRGEVAYPVDVASDGEGRIYVAEKGGKRVQVFREVEGFRNAEGVPVANPRRTGSPGDDVGRTRQKFPDAP